MRLTLDQLLAAQVDDFDQQQRRILDALENVITSETLQSYSTSVTVQPAAEALRAWLIAFRESMQQVSRRLTDSLKARVCFAENGMKLLLAFSRASLEAMRSLRGLVATLEAEVDAAATTTATARPGASKRTMEQQEVDPALAERLGNARRALLLLRDTLGAVLHQQASSISFLAEWLSFLTYAVPERLKSIDTSLTKENTNFLTNLRR